MAQLLSDVEKLVEQLPMLERIGAAHFKPPHWAQLFDALDVGLGRPNPSPTPNPNPNPHPNPHPHPHPHPHPNPNPNPNP